MNATYPQYWKLSGNTLSPVRDDMIVDTNPTPTVVVVGENVILGDVCYLHTDGLYYRADASSLTDFPAVAIMKGSYAGGSLAECALSGTYVTNLGWAWTAGDLLYLASGSPGQIVSTKPSAPADIAQIIGYATAADTIYFYPQLIEPWSVLQAGENVVLYELCYLKSDGKYWRSDASTAATMPAVVMALGTINANNYGRFAQPGRYIHNMNWAWTPGQLLYASGTLGEIASARPAAPGDQVQIVGYATGNMDIFFNPQYTTVEVS